MASLSPKGLAGVRWRRRSRPPHTLYDRTNFQISKANRNPARSYRGRQNNALAGAGRRSIKTRILTISELQELYPQETESPDHLPAVTLVYGKSKLRPAKTTPEIARLRPLIYSTVWGTKTADGVRPNVSKRQLRNSRWTPRLANRTIQNHLDGVTTHYYFSRPRCRHLLAMIDIDVGKALGLGSVAGGIAFARHVSDILPGCHWEPSTNGQGQHGYALIDLGDDWPHVTPYEIREIFASMERDLQAIADDTGADIELVEVKGRPPEFDEDHCIVRFGTFAKIPRHLDRDLDPVDLTALRLVAADARMRLAVGIGHPDRRVRRPGAAIMLAGGKSIRGSCSGRFVDDAMLSMLPRFQRWADQLLNGEIIKSRGAKVEPIDLAIFLLLAWLFSGLQANDNHAMPVRRFQSMWQSLFDAGDITRGWDPGRFAAVRNFLSDRGLIRCVDERYWWDGTGGGQACRWKLTSELMGVIDGLHDQGGEREAPSVVSLFSSVSCDLDSLDDLPRTGTSWRPRRVWRFTVPRMVSGPLSAYRLAG